jgi:hypothetical protein
MAEGFWWSVIGDRQSTSDSRRIGGAEQTGKKRMATGGRKTIGCGCPCALVVETA